MKKQISVLALAMAFAGTSFAGGVVECPSPKYVVNKLKEQARKHPSPRTYSVKHEGMKHRFLTEFPNEEAKYINYVKLVDVDFLFAPEASMYRTGSSMSCSYKVMTSTGKTSIIVFRNRMKGSHLKLIGDHWNVINRTVKGEDTRNYGCDAPDLRTCKVKMMRK